MSTDPSSSGSALSGTARGGWLVAAVLLVALSVSAWFMLHQASAHPFSGRAKPPVCGALGTPGTGDFITATARSDGLFADFDSRAVRCDVLVGAARVELAVLTAAVLPSGGSAPGSQGYVESFLKQQGSGGVRFASVNGPWRSAYVEDGRGVERLIADDNGVVVLAAARNTDRETFLRVARGAVEALRAAPPPD